MNKRLEHENGKAQERSGRVNKNHQREAESNRQTLLKIRNNKAGSKNLEIKDTS